MRLALTGGTGFIGTAMVRRLEAEGHDVCLIRRNDVLVRSRGEELCVARGTERDALAVAGALQAFDADVVVHLATAFIAQHQTADVDALIHSNVLFGAFVLEAAARSGVPVVNVTSFWQHVDGTLRNPNSLYAATKNALLAIADFYRNRDDLRILDLVLYDVYGERDTRRKLLTVLVEAAKSGKAIELSSGLQLINLLHVDDVVSGILQAVDCLMSGDQAACYSVKAEAFLTIREVVAEVEVALSVQLEARWGARTDRLGEMLEPWIVADAVPGWRPTIALDTGIRRIAQTAGE
jgi:nucleoside-diphosphate-sugar epimerase